MSPISISLHSMLRTLPRSTSVLALSIVIPSLHAQSAAVPIAGLFAGGGNVCSSSLPVYSANGTDGAKYGDGCPANEAVLSTPAAVAADSLGNVYIADQANHLIRVVYNGGKAVADAIVAANVQQANLVPKKGYIYTVVGGGAASPAATWKYYCNQAGSGTVAQNRSLNGCPGTQMIAAPRGLAVDADGNLFYTNVGLLSSVGVLYIGGAKAAALITHESPAVTPQAGYTYNLTGTQNFSYSGDGSLAYSAGTNSPRGVFVDANENVYFSDNMNLAIRRIDGTTGIISTVAGHTGASVSSCGSVTFSGDGGAATSATLACPYAEWLDKSGNLFIAEAGNGSTLSGRIRVVYAAGDLPGLKSPKKGNIYTYAGAPGNSKPATEAQLATFQNVFGVAGDSNGALYITDYRTGSSGSNEIWRIDPTTGAISAIAGNSGDSSLPVGQHCTPGSTGPVTTDRYGDGCPANLAYLNNPQQSVAFDGHGTFYVADRTNNIVRSFTFDNSSAIATGATR